MDNDDKLIGRVLSRREVLKLMGIGGVAALIAGCDVPTTPTAAPTEAAASGSTAVPGCVVRPELSEGPFFFDAPLNRADIRSDPATGEVKAGVPLRLEVAVSQLAETACVPLSDVVVNVWHCDADGAYSGVPDEGQYLRGYQLTDEQGVATFQTIYPGWYPGRAVHIHFKLRTDPESAEGAEFTSQWFFDEALTETVFEKGPYPAPARITTNQQDGLYQAVGEEMILNVEPDGEGYVARFEVALDLARTASLPDTGSGPQIVP